MRGVTCDEGGRARAARQAVLPERGGGFIRDALESGHGTRQRLATTRATRSPVGHRAGLEARTAALLPCLMLARVDGKSPVEYLSDASRQVVRDRSIPHIQRPPTSIADLLASLRSSQGR